MNTTGSVAAIATVLFLGGLANPQTVANVGDARQRVTSINKLKRIALAFHYYHDAHRTFPAHAIYDKDGKTPLLSWRVAILPYIEEEALHKEFKLDEPWDSDHNKKLIPKMPKVYQFPVGKSKEDETYYQVVTGPMTVFDGPKKISLQKITDGTSNTLLVLEAKDSVIWTKPADLTLPKEKDKKIAVGQSFDNGFITSFCDGSTRLMPGNISAETMRAMITPTGGEVVEIPKSGTSRP